MASRSSRNSFGYRDASWPRRALFGHAVRANQRPPRRPPSPRPSSRGHAVDRFRHRGRDQPPVVVASGNRYRCRCVVRCSERRVTGLSRRRPSQHVRRCRARTHAGGLLRMRLQHSGASLVSSVHCRRRSARGVRGRAPAPLSVDRRPCGCARPPDRRRVPAADRRSPCRTVPDCAGREGRRSRGPRLHPRHAVALELAAGFVAIRKAGAIHPGPKAVVRAAADWRGNEPELVLQRAALRDGDRVLLADDWIETGSQALAARKLIEECGGRWAGLSVLVDQSRPAIRRRLEPVAAVVGVDALPPSVGAR